MIYKFDILFKKTLVNGSIKVVTYSQLLDNPKTFGKNETLEGAVGELSVVKEGTDMGFALNSLLRKYHVQLVGRMNAENWGKEMPLQFVFCDKEDVGSIRIELKDEKGYLYSSQVKTVEVHGQETLDLVEFDSFVAIVAKEGDVTIVDEIGATVLNSGEVGFVSASTGKIEMVSKNGELILISTL